MVSAATTTVTANRFAWIRATVQRRTGEIAVVFARCFDTFNSFDFFNLDILDLCRLLLKIQRLTILSVWHGSCPYRTCKNVMPKRGGTMSPVLIFFRKWNKWYRVLRYRKGFGLLDSVRYGVWLAHT